MLRLSSSFFILSFFQTMPNMRKLQKEVLANSTNLRVFLLFFFLLYFSSKEQTGRRAGSCRVCLKNFKPEDYSRICFGCKMKVCEDCASYSKQSENEDEVSKIFVVKVFECVFFFTLLLLFFR